MIIGANWKNIYPCQNIAPHMMCSDVLRLFVGDIYGKVTQEIVNEMVLKALKSGINFIDTAPWYGQGVSEERLGVALKAVPRHTYYIATKV